MSAQAPRRTLPPAHRASHTLALLLLLSGCKSATPPKDFGVNVTIDSSAVLDRAGLATLRVAVTGEAQPYEHDFDVRTKIADTQIFHTHYVPAIASGQLSFEARLLSGDGTVRATASPVSATVIAGQATEVTLTLSTGALPDAGPDSLPAECKNGQMDPGESDIDCSGTCPKCEPGRLCATVDDCATRTCVAGRCELATDSPGWVTITALPAARTSAAAVAREDGSVWVLGGSTTGIDTATLSYTSATNEWSAGAPLPAARMQMPAVAIGDQVYVIGGLTPTGGSSTDALASIVLGSGSPLAWNAAMRTLGSKAYLHGAALGSDGQIYVGGGLPGPGMPASTQFVSFDPVDGADAPVSLAAMPSPRSEFGLAADFAGHIVAVAGAGMDSMANGSTDIYTITTKTWSAGPTLQHTRRNAGTIAGADGRVYVVGGNDDAGGAMETVEALSLDGTRWSNIAPLTPSRTQVAIARGWDGRIYAIGGQVGGAGALTPTTIVQAYGPRIVPGPATGAPGTVVAVTGTNFAASAKVTLTFSGDTPGVIAQSRATNETGQVAPSFVWTVPQVAPGTYFLTAVDDRSRYPVRARFVVQ